MAVFLNLKQSLKNKDALKANGNMKILAHPLKTGGYITYLLDHTGRPLLAEIKNTKEEIVKYSSELSRKYKVSKAEYVDDFIATSKKPKWKISVF